MVKNLGAMEVRMVWWGITGLFYGLSPIWSLLTRQVRIITQMELPSVSETYGSQH